MTRAAPMVVDGVSPCTMTFQSPFFPIGEIVAMHERE